MGRVVLLISSLAFHHQTGWVSSSFHMPIWVLSLLWLSLFIPSGAISPLFSSSILGNYLPGGVHLSLSHIFAFLYCLWVSQGKSAEVVCHCLLQWTMFCQNSTMTHRSWMGLHSMVHSFTELRKAVIYLIILVSFLWLWFSFCLLSDGCG